MSDSSVRVRKVSEQIKKAISSIILNDIDDRRVHDVVITAVKLTNDLGIARIYFSSYNKEAMNGIEIGLNNSKGFIRKQMSRYIQLKKLPEIIFERDNGQEHVERLDEIFSQIHAEEGN